MSSGVLTFNRNAVLSVMDHALNAPEHNETLYGAPAFDGPGLMLVGDQGIYLMSNGRPIDLVDYSHIAYANECNPGVMPFDEWWEAKRRIFGGDDAAEAVIDRNLSKWRDRVAAANGLKITLSKTIITTEVF